MKGLASVVVPISLLLTQMSVSGAPVQVQPPDSDLVTIVRMVKGFEALKHARAKVWPSYDPGKVPIFVFRPGEVGYLFNYPPPFPRGFQSVDGYPGIAVLYHPRGFQRGINIHQAFGDRVGVSVELKHDPAWKDKEFLVAIHEAFHVHQRTLPIGGLSAQELEVRSARDLALAELEQLYLAEALGGSQQETRQRLQLFLAIRFERQKAMSQDDWQHEVGLEAKEGTAHYVEMLTELLESDSRLVGLSEALLAGGDRDLPPRIVLLREQLLAPLDKLTFARSRYYLTGAVMGLVLDRLLPGWKVRVEQGQPLALLVAEACGYRAETQAALFKQVLAAHDLDDAVARLQVQLEDDDSEAEVALKRFNSTSGMKVKLRLPKGAQPSLTVDDMVPLNRVDSLLRGGSLPSLEQSGCSILIRGTSLVAYEGERGQFVITFFLSPQETDTIAPPIHMQKSGSQVEPLTLRTRQIQLSLASARVFRDAEGIAIEID